MTRGPYRKSLTKAQLDILIALYKFRFITVDLVVEYMGLKTKTHSYNRLKSLVEQEYVDKRYSNTDSIDRRPAVYFALSGAINVLKANTGLDKTALNAMYKDKLTSQPYIDRFLLTFAIFNRFKATYGNQRLDFFTKREMSQHDFFPKPLPDAYITIKNEGREDSRFFLELFDANTQNKKQWQRIKFYMDHCGVGDWEDETEWGYPSLLYICETPQVEKRIQRHAEKLQSSTGAEMNVYTTSCRALLAAKSAKEAIWSDIDEPEELISLS